MHMFFDLSAVSHIMRIPTDEEWDLFMDAVHEDDSIAHWKGVFFVDERSLVR